ncbi:hypothetical protein Cgig2_011913 [Carnegiea gigantea]|uniref:Mediator of RNA polymerase II transcription subunit 20 n=1 Tax=Carnegiea gigantea TaxID=171969 RepID=A0A9Q1K2R8_9CARY|nr:hypothetical protein Cgig2_011913 [Carnegiea gigantea]
MPSSVLTPNQVERCRSKLAVFTYSSVHSSIHLASAFLGTSATMILPGGLLSAVTATNPIMVLHWHPNAGATVNTQIMNEISQCIESLNGVKEGRWKSVLTFYKPITREQSMAAEFPRDFLGLSIPEQSNKYYFIIRAQRIVLEADSTIQTIMEKLQSYKSRVALNFEGTQYRVGDFQVRVAKVAPSYSETMRGIIMETDEVLASGAEHELQLGRALSERVPIRKFDKFHLLIKPALLPSFHGAMSSSTAADDQPSIPLPRATTTHPPPVTSAHGNPRAPIRTP